jgi:TonB family protein
VKYTYKIYKFPLRATNAFIVPENSVPAPHYRESQVGPPRPETPAVVKLGAAGENAGRTQAATPVQPGIPSEAGRTGTAGRGAPGPSTGPAPAQGFRLVYRKGAELELAKKIPDPLEDLVRPERYRSRSDVNLSKYIRPKPVKPDASVAGGAARAAVAAKSGEVAAVAATPAGGAEIPDNVRRFDFSPWANEVMAKIQKHWSLLPYGGGFWKGEVGVLVMVSKSGEVLGSEIKVSSNVDLLDRVALSALQAASPLPSLPADFPNSSVEMYLVFKYGY